MNRHKKGAIPVIQIQPAPFFHNHLISVEFSGPKIRAE